MGSIFEEFFTGFGGMSSGRTRRNAPRRGADLRVDVSLSFEAAAFGTDHSLEVPRMETCDSCRGDGAEPGTSPGSGSETEARNGRMMVRSSVWLGLSETV